MTAILGLVLLVALCIPVLVLIARSPIGRAFGWREHEPSPLRDVRDDEFAELRRRVELLEGDLEIMQHTLGEVREQNEFLQQLLENDRPGHSLPPGGG